MIKEITTTYNNTAHHNHKMSLVRNQIPRVVSFISRIVHHKPDISYKKYISVAESGKNYEKIYKWSKLPEVVCCLPTYDEMVASKGNIIISSSRHYGNSNCNKD